jgi:preprotein translocase subunit SecG
LVFRFTERTEDEMKLFLQILLIGSSVFLVIAVLLHRLAGSSVAEKNLDRITLGLGAVWVISIVGLGLLLKL